MSGRLVPAYVSKAGWGVYSAYLEFLETDDPDVLADAVTELRDALLRDPSSAALDAPEDVLATYLAAS